MTNNKNQRIELAKYVAERMVNHLWYINTIDGWTDLDNAKKSALFFIEMMKALEDWVNHDLLEEYKLFLYETEFFVNNYNPE